MKTQVRGTKVELTLSLSGDEAFFLWALAYSKSAGSPAGLRNQVEGGLAEMMDALAEASGLYRAAREAFYLTPAGLSIGDRINAALAKGRAA